MKIGITGYYGQGNFGDELFLETFKQVFHDHTVYPIVSHINHFDSDSVIVGGGDLIIPYSFNDMYFPKSLLKVPTWVYGVGIVDFYPPETWPEAEVAKYREIITRAKGLFVRDSNSEMLANYLKLNKTIQKVPDIAFSYKQPNYPIIKNPSKKTLGVCSFSYDEFPLDKMANILSTLPADEYTLALIAVVDIRNRFSDYNTCVKLKEKILMLNPKADIVIKNYQYLDVTYSHIQALDFLVSFKLHPSLVGIRNNVPTLCLSKLSKVKSLLQAFDLTDFFCNYDEDEIEIQRKLDLLLKTGEERMALTSHKIKEIEQLSDLSLKKLKEEIENTHQSKNN